MAILGKDDILNADDRKTVTVHVPEWSGEVILSVMTGYDRDKFEASIIGKNGGQNLQNIRAKMIAMCAVDEQNKLLFSEAELIKLGKKSSAALDRLYEACQKLNYLSDRDVEQLAKN